MKPVITWINGSLGGANGNTGALLERWTATLSLRAEIHALHLSEGIPSLTDLRADFERSQGFIFSTGTYWDSWGSPLQRFLEMTTALEGSEAWLGKPASVLVTMHSVGGKEVLSRLQGVLSTLGLMIPPMSGMAYSLAGHLAFDTKNEFAEDFWNIGDFDVIGHNLLEAIASKRGSTPQWRAWNVDRQDPSRRWLD